MEFVNATSIELFMYDVISIIDKGYKETIEEIENQIENRNIAQYIIEKYKDIVMMENSDTNTLIKNRIITINDSYLDHLEYTNSNESSYFSTIPKNLIICYII